MIAGGLWMAAAFCVAMVRMFVLAVASLLVALLAAIDGWRGVEAYPTEVEP